MKFLATVVSIALWVTVVFVPQSAKATQVDTGWVISNFDSEITIESDGKVSVKEKISVDFKDLDRHGIFRHIPYRYTADATQKSYSRIEDISAEIDNTPEQFSTSKSGDYLVIKIGDPDTFVTGSHLYTISYRVSGVLKSFDSYDELYWNVTGDAWPVPIEKAQATVYVPEQGIEQASCYQGAYGSTESCSAVTESKKAAFAASRELAPGEGFTIAAGFTKGMVPIIVVESPLVKNSILGFMFGITMLILGLKIRRRLHEEYKLVKLKQRNLVVAPEYEAPDKLRPAEVGLILDTHTQTLDISATIVDLAVRGYLTITDLKEETGEKDYRLTLLNKSTDELSEYEKELLQELFSGTDSVNIQKLKGNFWQVIARVAKMVSKQLVSKGYFSSDAAVGRNVAITAIVLLVIIGFITGFGAVIWPALIGVLIACAVLGLFFIIDAFTLTPVTEQGREAYRKVLGYKMFLSATEKYRQPYFEDKNYFMDVLPYAMVFGVTDKLAKSFEKMGIEPAQPSWFVGPHYTAFAFSDFSNSMQSFGSQFNSAAAPPSSSSGSGGGGSSGGGSGGGGGGSW